MEEQSQREQPRFTKEEDSDPNSDDANLFEEEDEESSKQKHSVKKSKKQGGRLHHKKISKDKSHQRKAEKKRKHRKPPTAQRNVKNQEEERLDNICKKKAETILENMKTKANHDIKRNKAGQSSTQKLEYLETLTKDLETAATAEYFLQADGLQLFQKWLKKYPDGTEPSYSLKKGCFKILFGLPMTAYILSKSQSLLTLIQKHQSSKERDLKQLAEGISFKWSCILADRYDNQSD